LPEDHVLAVKRISGIRTDESGRSTAADDAAAAAADDAEATDTDTNTDTDTAGLIEAIRATAHKGRLNGDLQRLGVVLSDACLADCVEELGEAADLPGLEDLEKVMPGLVDKHGVGVVRMMLASTVVGEAPASATIVGMLKNDDLVKLPPGEDKPLAPLLPLKQDDAERLALKAQRKERKAQEQAAARLRREQLARAKNRV
jgi:hypothetical protein